VSRTKILVTGATGRVGTPLIRELSKENETWGLARFTSLGSREMLERLGVTCVAMDLADERLDDLPDDFTHVVHAGAIVYTGGSERDPVYTLELNAQATGRLMYHCRRAETFVHCSTGGVYRYSPEPVKESDLLGSTIGEYSLSKIVAESLVTFLSRQWKIPTVILRIGMVWGLEGGGPARRVDLMVRNEEVVVSAATPSYSSLIWEDDAVRMIEDALKLGEVPPLVVNLGGDEAVATEEYCAYAGELLGLEPTFRYTDETYPGTFMDPTRRQAIFGPCRIDWREGMRRLIEDRYPELRKP
jgi:UDP-glucuronate 4-epimerase